MCEHMHICICDICTCMHRCLCYMHVCVCVCGNAQVYLDLWYMNMWVYVCVVCEHLCLWYMCGICTCVCVVYAHVYKCPVSIYVCMCEPEENFGHPALLCLCHLSLRQSPSLNLYLSWQLGSPGDLRSTSSSVTVVTVDLQAHAGGQYASTEYGKTGFCQGLWTSEAPSRLCLFPAAAPAETMQGTR